MYETKIIEKAQECTVFTTNTMRDLVKVPRDKYAVFNTEITRLEKAGKLTRLGKGVYVCVFDTAFGPSLPTHAEIVKALYLNKGTGYTYGPTFFNQIGLSSWIPRDTYIKTIKKPVVNFEEYVFKAAPAECNQDNAVYFQLLDCIKDLDNFAVDTDDPHKVIRNYIERIGLDKVRLVVYCNRYCKSVLPKLMKIMESYYL